MLLPLVVVTRILVKPLSNVFQKLLTQRHADPLFIICLTHAWLSLLCLPLIFVHRPPPTTDFWLNITIVGVLTVAGNALLVHAVKTSDLSLLGPVNAYKSVVSLLPGMLLLREFPGPLGLAGIALIVAGSCFLVDKIVTEPRENALVRFFRDRRVQYRLAPPSSSPPPKPSSSKKPSSPHRPSSPSPSGPSSASPSPRRWSSRSRSASGSPTN